MRPWGEQIHFTSRVDKEPDQSCLISHNDQATVDVCAKVTQHSLCQFATGCNQEIVRDVWGRYVIRSTSLWMLARNVAYEGLIQVFTHQLCI